MEEEVELVGNWQRRWRWDRWRSSCNRQRSRWSWELISKEVERVEGVAIRSNFGGGGADRRGGAGGEGRMEG